MWHGKTANQHADEYLQYLQETGVKDCLATEGNRGVLVLRCRKADHAAFWFVSFWTSVDDVRRCAGEHIETARYYADDRQYLLELKPTVCHYEAFEFEALREAIWRK